MSEANPDGLISAALLRLLNSVPASRLARSEHPAEAAQQLTRAAASKAALTAGTLALPVGPLGWLTVLPELVAVWHIQAQMVADVAALYGAEHSPSPEQMLHCLFRHTAAQALRDLGVRASERLLVQATSGPALQALAKAIGMTLSQRAVASGVSRWLPVVGAVGVGAYAWYDTRQVGSSAITLFSQAADPASAELPMVERLS